MNDTIVACSTARGKGAVAIIRLSGSEALPIAEKVFSPMPKEPMRLVRGVFSAEYFKDDGMCVFFRAPKSMTGEDSVEFYLHGGTALVDGAIRECILRGARIAERGEFTKRAFLNGKMTLDACEGVIEMIDAESALAVRSGFGIMTGRLSEKADEMQTALTELIARIEVVLDYPEEDLELITAEEAGKELVSLKRESEKLLRDSACAPIIRNGADIVIVGRVNAGKSSLMNALLGRDRAIVSDEEGTTRDVIEASFNYKDMKFNLFDTAGLRETMNAVEAEGIRRAEEVSGKCDLILFVTDDLSEKREFSAPHIRVLNKCDQRNYTAEEGDSVISALTGEGVGELKERIYSFFEEKGICDSLVVTNARQLDCLKRADDAISQALSAIKEATMDCAAQPLYTAWNALGEITGRTVAEEIVDTVFSRFCLGK